MFITLILVIIVCAFVANMFSGGGSPHKTRQIFHGNYYAEDAVTSENDVPNSVESIEKCIEAGMGIKTELFLTKDRRAVVSAYNNLAIQYNIEKNISETDSGELGALGIMTVGQLIEKVGGRVPLILELKVSDHNESICRYTADAIKSSGFENIAVCSFHSGMIAWFKEKEKKIFRGLISAPAHDFKSLSKIDRFMTGNLANNSVSRPHFILYRNKPQSILVKFAFYLGTVKGIWTMTDQQEAKEKESDNAMIVSRGFMPEKPHYQDLPERQKTRQELAKEKKAEERAARRQIKEEYKRQLQAEKAAKAAEKENNTEE